APTISAALSGASSTFGHERFSSIVTSSRSEHVSAYSDAENPPTETQSGTPSSRSLGSVSPRNRSRPGLASPIELSIPTSVSAIRTGALPPRGSGVTVFVTKASSERATSGAVSASRQPEAFRSIGRSLDPVAARACLQRRRRVAGVDRIEVRARRYDLVDPVEELRVELDLGRAELAFELLHR